MKYVFWLIGLGLVGGCVGIISTVSFETDRQLIGFLMILNQGLIFIGLGYLAAIYSKLKQHD